MAVKSADDTLGYVKYTWDLTDLRGRVLHGRLDASRENRFGNVMRFCTNCDQHFAKFVPKISSTLDVNGFMSTKAIHVQGSHGIKIFETRGRYV